MLNKDELLLKDISELEDIAASIGAEYKSGDDKESIIYAILDRQAVEGSQNNPAATKRRRTRIVKKDTDHVYTVSGKDGENFDVKKNKVTTEQQTLFKEEIPSENTAPAADKQMDNGGDFFAAFPKHRGRKSKAELEAIAAAEALMKQNNEEQAQEATVEDAVLEVEPIADCNKPETEMPMGEDVPEAVLTGTEGKDEETKNELLAQLQAKMIAHNEQAEEHRNAIVDGVWADDPADGTDFIVVMDLPIEDHGAVPTYDMFDRPTTPVMSPAPSQMYMQNEAAPIVEDVYDFSDLIKANGVLEVMPDGYGFLRSSDYNYLSSPDDVYVASQHIKRYGLKTGDVVECHVRPPHDGEKYFPLTSIDKINGRNPSEVRNRIPFEHLPPLFPEEN